MMSALPRCVVVMVFVPHIGLQTMFHHVQGAIALVEHKECKWCYWGVTLVRIPEELEPGELSLVVSFE